MDDLLKKSHLLFALVLAFVALVTVSAPTAMANTNNNVKPGWGYGDKNHIHIGPPGQSVRPSIVDRLKDREDSIVDKLSDNKKIPEPQKTDIINQVESVFNQLIHIFS